MRIIGELINASREEVKEALENKDKATLQKLARKQVEAGAGILDVNVGLGKPEEEPALMGWLVTALQEATNIPLCLDTDNTRVLEAGLKQCKKAPLVNSISVERKRLDAFLPLIKEYNVDCIALAIGGRKIPSQSSERLKICKRIFEEVVIRGTNKEKIYFDPLVTSVGADTNGPSVTLETLKGIKREIPKAKTVLALSNVSYGLPKRKLLNQVFLEMCLPWTDAVILDPLDEDLMNFINTREISFDKEDVEVARKALRGDDEDCDEYIQRFSEGLDLEEII